MNSPRYRPAGLLVAWHGARVMLDGGDAAVPASRVDAWLVTDLRAELIADIRRRCRAMGLVPAAGAWQDRGLRVAALPVAHTAHPTYGYLIEAAGRRVVWAPEFWRFPAWAAGADLMFADAAGWARPIRFAGGVGGHACVLDTAGAARRHGVRRLVYAHIGRPSIRARDAGQRPPFGEWGSDDRVYRLTPVADPAPEHPARELPRAATPRAGTPPRGKAPAPGRTARSGGRPGRYPGTVEDGSNSARRERWAL